MLGATTSERSLYNQGAYELMQSDRDSCKHAEEEEDCGKSCSRVGPDEQAVLGQARSNDVHGRSLLNGFGQLRNIGVHGRSLSNELGQLRNRYALGWTRDQKQLERE